MDEDKCMVMAVFHDLYRMNPAVMHSLPVGKEIVILKISDGNGTRRILRN